jgi:hypothetical protein
MTEKLTIQTFVEEWPLYACAMIEGSFGWPSNISRFCESCGKETTWPGSQVDCSASGIMMRRYGCLLCSQTQVVYVVHYKYAKQGNTQAYILQKIGQHPASSIAISRSLGAHLGESATMYKKALISRNQGYGIAAVAYLRRIVEDKTDELIDIVGQLARGRGLSEADIQGILAAKNQQTYSDKLKVASEVIPATLRPGGSNPFGTLYGLLSDGLHDRTEEECLAIADEIREVFEYVFENLRTQIEDEKRFIDKMTKLTSRQKA